MLPAVSSKPAEFVGTAEDDLATFPNDVKSVLGFAIFQAQIGGRHQRANR
jgi:phage-related protein